MADKNFVVKNGIVVNTAFSANSSGLYYSGALLANSTQVNAASFTGNAAFLGGNTAADLRSYSDTKAGTAYSNAIAYSGNAAQAYSNAIATAATDATNKAATAYSNAISTAATDATNKAATAYSNAIAYSGNAALAYANAIAYSGNAALAYSNAVSTAATDASTKAGTAYSNAIATAATDASTKAATAYSNAIAYSGNAALAYSNATSYVDGKSYVNTAQLTNNLANYQTTAGLASNVAGLSAADSAALGGYASGLYLRTSNFSTTLGTYLPLYGSVVNASSVNVGTSTIANATGVYTGIVNGSTIQVGTFFTATSTLVNAAALNVVNQTNTGSLYVTTSANISTTVVANATGLYLPNTSGVAWSANTTRMVIGDTVAIQANGTLGTANQVLTTNGSGVYWANGGGTGSTYTKGNAGPIGDASAANNIFRVNANTVSNNITFDAQDNASATGPLTVETGYTITVSAGARVVIL